MSNKYDVVEWKFKSHGRQFYDCSRFQENPNLANESSHALAREALKKYLFYFEKVSISFVIV